MAILTIIIVLHQLTHQTAQVSQFAKVDFETIFIIILDLIVFQIILLLQQLLKQYHQLHQQDQLV